MTVSSVGDRITWLGRPGTIIAIGKGLAKYTIEIEGKNGNRVEIFSQKEFTKNIELVCDNSIYAQESAQVSLLLESNTDYPSLDSANVTNGATQSSNLDTPPFQSRQKCETWNAYDKSGKKRKSSQLRHLANRSQSKEKGQAEPTIEIVSQPSLQQSILYSPITLPSKTCQESLIAHTNQSMEQEPITTIFSATFTPSGTMQNGKLLAADTLGAHSLEKGFCWLESPGALSSENSRPPGLSRLESQLKSHRLLSKGEVLNPDFLLNSFSIPKTFLNHSECRTAQELLDDNERQPEIFSIPGSQQLPSTELSTSNQSGSIYKYEKVIKGTRYPKDLGNWYYGYSYVVQIDGKWCDRSKSVSIKKLPFVLEMVAEKRNYLEILDFLG
ncbi:MAG: hypothetical protein ABI417_11100 [Coleofasciculaceae cyanobacterium]